MFCLSKDTGILKLETLLNPFGGFSSKESVSNLILRNRHEGGRSACWRGLRGAGGGYDQDTLHTCGTVKAQAESPPPPNFSM